MQKNSAQKVQQAYNNAVKATPLRKTSLKFNIRTFLIPDVTLYPTVLEANETYCTTNGFFTGTNSLDQPIPFFLFGLNDAFNFNIGRKALDYASQAYTDYYNIKQGTTQTWRLWGSFIYGEKTAFIFPVLWQGAAVPGGEMFPKYIHLHPLGILNGDLVTVYLCDSIAGDTPHILILVVSCEEKSYNLILKSTAEFPIKSLFIDYTTDNPQQLNIPLTPITFNSLSIYKGNKLMPSAYKGPYYEQEMYRIPFNYSINPYFLLASAIHPVTQTLKLEMSIYY
ncbi:MAG: hypothetical protein WC389_05405 [Lutibacter sp.]|jgi:hypothetical protein